MEMPKLGWNWIQECSSGKKNWNMQQCVGKIFMIVMMVLR